MVTRPRPYPLHIIIFWILLTVADLCIKFGMPVFAQSGDSVLVEVPKI